MLTWKVAGLFEVRKIDRDVHVALLLITAMLPNHMHVCERGQMTKLSSFLSFNPRTADIPQRAEKSYLVNCCVYPFWKMKKINSRFFFSFQCLWNNRRIFNKRQIFAPSKTQGGQLVSPSWQPRKKPTTFHYFSRKTVEKNTWNKNWHSNPQFTGVLVWLANPAPCSDLTNLWCLYTSEGARMDSSDWWFL